MKLKFNIRYTVLIISALLASCAKDGRGEEYADSIHEITFSHPTLSAEAIASKAGLYDSSNIIDEEHHGNFSVIAYEAGKKNKLFPKPERVYYMYYSDAPKESRWRFYDNNDFYIRYWPQSIALDFIAYMPWDLAGWPESFNMDEQTFSCTLPLDKSGQDNVKEFVCAYEPNLRHTDNNGQVNLNFRHPFAAVKFMLGEAHGNTEIHTVGLTNMFVTGTLDIPNWEWSNSTNDGDKKGRMDIDIDKTVGTAGDSGIQLNSLIGGPYLIIPQETDEIKISISFTWNDTHRTAEASIGSGTWQPGFIYTYKLNLGDNDEDILADVIISEWKVVTDRHEIEVE